MTRANKATRPLPLRGCQIWQEDLLLVVDTGNETVDYVTAIHLYARIQVKRMRQINEAQSSHPDWGKLHVFFLL